MRFTKIRDVKSPCRAHSTDAGIDFFVPNDFTTTYLQPNEDILIPAGVKVVVPEGYALIFKEKSGVATKLKLTLGASVVDSDYRGEVHLHLINSGSEEAEIKPGQKITQGLLVPISLETAEEVSNDEYAKYENTDRGACGFGSTGVA